MAPVTVSYPLDPTGVSPLNLVQGEIQNLVPNRKVYAVAPLYGAFFSDSLQVTNSVTHQVYVRDVDFYAANLYDLPSAKYGEDICSIVIISNDLLTQFGGNLSLTYQALGGPYGDQAASVASVLNNLKFVDRTPEWAYPLQNPKLLPESSRLFDLGGDVYGFEYVVQALDRIAHALQNGDEVAHDAIYQYIDAHRDDVNYEVIEQTRLRMVDLMAAHLRASDPHSQYLMRTAQVQVDPVRKPTNISPANATPNAGVDMTFTGSVYAALYRLPQKAAQYQLSKNAGCVAPFVFDQAVAGVNNVFHYLTNLEFSTQYYWRVRYQNIEDVWSTWSDVTTFTTLAAGVNQPTITAPAPNATGVGEQPNFVASAFTAFGASDTHQSSDWEIWTGPNGTGTLAHSSLLDTVNKTTLSIPKNKLLVSTTYYPRVRYHGASGRVSAYSANQSFTTAATFFPTVIGQAFGGGYFVGNIKMGVDTYAVLMAPKASGEITTSRYLESKLNESTFYSNVDSVANTSAMLSQGSLLAQWARSLTIGGFNDWQIPARHVLELMYRNARPTGVNNYTASGDNPDSIPIGSNYTLTDPAQSSLTMFKTGGSEALTSTVSYWSSTADTAYQTSNTVTNPDIPIYNTVVDQSNPHARINSIAPAGQDESAGSYLPSNGCGDTPGTTESDLTFSFVPNFGSSSAWITSWNCPTYKQVIVGYTPGGTSTIVTDFAPAWTKRMSDGAELSVERNTNGLYARAVRLVKVS